MEKFEIIKLFFNTLAYILGSLKSIKKNQNILYVNSNVKNANIEEISYLVKPRDTKIIDCQSGNKITKMRLKFHLFKMKVCITQVIRNSRNSTNITYCGFVSQMFSIFDGYSLGNTLNYGFVDYSDTYYKIDAKKRQLINQNNSKRNDENVSEINLIIETSYVINKKHLPKPKLPTLIFDKKAPKEITNDYLDLVYSYVKNVLDACGKTNIKRVNLFITAKQSVSFTVGTAIQKYHPEIYIYEFAENNYKYYLKLKEQRICKVKNGFNRTE